MIAEEEYKIKIIFKAFYHCSGPSPIFRWEKEQKLSLSLFPIEKWEKCLYK